MPCMTRLLVGSLALAAISGCPFGEPTATPQRVAPSSEQSLRKQAALADFERVRLFAACYERSLLPASLLERRHEDGALPELQENLAAACEAEARRLQLVAELDQDDALAGDGEPDAPPLDPAELPKPDLVLGRQAVDSLRAMAKRHATVFELPIPVELPGLPEIEANPGDEGEHILQERVRRILNDGMANAERLRQDKPEVALLLLLAAAEHAAEEIRAFRPTTWKDDSLVILDDFAIAVSGRIATPYYTAAVTAAIAGDFDVACDLVQMLVLKAPRAPKLRRIMLALDDHLAGLAATRACDARSLRDRFDFLALTYYQDVGPELAGQCLPKKLTNGIGMTLVLLEPVTFPMGAPKSEYDADPFHLRNRHPVTLTRPFYVATTEVTQSQFAAVVGRNPSVHTHDDAYALPVENVSWGEAADFCSTLTLREAHQSASTVRYRLPTEAEWEYACRGDHRDDHSLGYWSWDVNGIGWCQLNSSDRTQRVARKTPNNFGLFDMLGNVGEWCADWQTYLYYFSDEPIYNPRGPDSGTCHVVRGGSYTSNDREATSAWRDLEPPSARHPNVGFRVVAELPLGRVEATRTARTCIGVTLEDFTAPPGEFRGQSISSGVKVSKVRKDSPAEKAGIIAGDILIMFDGATVRTVPQYKQLLWGSEMDSLQRVIVFRDGRQVSLMVRVERKTPATSSARPNPSKQTADLET